MAFFEKQTAGWRSYDFNNPGTNDPAVLRQRVQSGQGTSVPNLNLLKKDIKTPYNQQFSVGWGQTLAEGLALNVDFIHQNAKNLYVYVTPNWLNSQTNHRNLTDAYGTITLYDDFGEATFDALVGNVTYDRTGLRLTSSTIGWYESTHEGLGSYNDETFFVIRPECRQRARFVFRSVTCPRIQAPGMAVIATPRPCVATVRQT
jgi:hypothetical protein